ncbi:hypothetical protein BpHYR1_043827 [Brachionus plicatilis]|uniref:Uncharacterized protein n=1 Tax=Brachionus plicatilis TaxID=10195 RepID=A0A3M7RWC9_BRAPC|nr:hypothetical protein BpHYR1_043827 [Brachionus plicatilis]
MKENRSKLAFCFKSLSTCAMVFYQYLYFFLCVRSDIYHRTNTQWYAKNSIHFHLQAHLNTEVIGGGATTALASGCKHRF